MEPDVSARDREQQSKSIILVVNDEPLIRLNFAEELRDAGYDVLEASGPAEALSLLECFAIDIVCTDVVMPGELDGIALAEMTRAHWPRIKIVVISGNLFTRPPPSIADAFFVKPCAAAALVASVSELLATRRS